jgi:hypothetical protein
MNNQLIASSTPIEPNPCPANTRNAEAQVLSLEAARTQRNSGCRSGSSPVWPHPKAARPDDAHLHEAQLRHELVLAYADLGGATFALAHHGAPIDPRLDPRVQRIRDLAAELAALT